MKEEILTTIDHPKQLEHLFRENKSSFKKEFNLIYPHIKDKLIAQIWNERLNYEKDEISWGSNKELIFIIIASFIAGLISKIPAFTEIHERLFYQKNTAFIVFPLLIAYFCWRQKIQLKKLPVIAAALLASVLYINVLPNIHGDTFVLACIHLPLFLWAVLGYAFAGGNLKNIQKRLDFLRYNGDLVVITTIILITGTLLTFLTIGLFSLISIRIEDFYFEYIVVWGLSASPIVGTYLIQSNPQLVNKVSPIIAKVFTPLVFVTLVMYLLVVLVTGKDPYNDRDFLLMFNILLMGVMAIIVFSIAATSRHSNSKIGILLLLGLSIVTIIINGIALSAILFRISEWGITPNRLAVLGGNILILTNLLMVSYKLFKTTINRNDIESIEKSIASFLPIYGLWTLVVTFVFPILFAFK